MHTTPSTKTIVNQIIDQDSLSELLKQEASHGLVFEQCEFDGLNLHQLDLQGAQFVECSFADTCFESCQLAGTRWLHCKAGRADFRLANLTDALFCQSRSEEHTSELQSQSNLV